jgi:ATPase subunit of ABC transporter with duplicated ATPase domains
LISNFEDYEEGKIFFSHDDLKIGFLNQEPEIFGSEENEEKKLINFLIEDLPEYSGLSEEEIFDKIKETGIFLPQELNGSFKNLSIGCKRKAQLIKIFYKNPDILLLDEPTNHIDMLGLEKIENLLENFKGTIISSSHDRYFIQKFSEKRINLEKIL